MESKDLIQILLTNPDKFERQGLANELLKKYFQGLSLDTLAQLLKNKNNIIKKEALWIISELGEEACSQFMDEIYNISTRPADVTITHLLMECIFLGTLEQDGYLITYLFDKLSHKEQFIRIEAMHLIANINSYQLRELKKLLENKLVSADFLNAHNEGCQLLMSGKHNIAGQAISVLKESRPMLVSIYAAIIGKRVFDKYPEVIRTALQNSYSDIRLFAEQVLELNSE